MARYWKGTVLSLPDGTFTWEGASQDLLLGQFGWDGATERLANGSLYWKGTVRTVANHPIESLLYAEADRLLSGESTDPRDSVYVVIDNQDEFRAALAALAGRRVRVSVEPVEPDAGEP
jgi:hypothetical protein